MPRVPPAVFHTSTPLAPTLRVGGSGLVHMLNLQGRISRGVVVAVCGIRLGLADAMCITVGIVGRGRERGVSKCCPMRYLPATKGQRLCRPS
jgi:hypothetical protein